MREELALSPDEAEAFARANCPDEIAELLCSVVDSHRDEVESLLAPYCVQTRGEVSHESTYTESGRVQLREDRRTGTILIDFIEHVHWGCKDMERNSDMQASIQFKIDLETRVVTLVGADPAERDPDEF